MNEAVHAGLPMLGTAEVYADLESLLGSLGPRRDTLGKIGLTSGTFDLLHIGHMEYLERARRVCDFLLVGVDSDQAVATRKGSDRPVLGQIERMAMLAHLRHVNAVFGKPSISKWYSIRRVCADVLIVSEATYDQSELEQLRAICPEVTVLSVHPWASTSDPRRLAGWIAHTNE